MTIFNVVLAGRDSRQTSVQQGLKYQLEQLTSTQFGQRLIKLGSLVSQPFNLQTKKLSVIFR